jgi:hypothetical protein
MMHVDWRRKRVRVKPSEHSGRSRWSGGGRATSFELARAHHDVLAGRLPGGRLLSGGADLQVAKERLGHGSLRTTEKYLHTLPGADETALKALSVARSRGRTLARS